MWVLRMITDELVKTERREAREHYSRYILFAAGLEVEDIDVFMNERQAILENRSPLEMIYSGDYKRGVAAVELFIDGLED